MDLCDQSVYRNHCLDRTGFGALEQDSVSCCQMRCSVDSMHCTPFVHVLVHFCSVFHVVYVAESVVVWCSNWA